MPASPPASPLPSASERLHLGVRPGPVTAEVRAAATAAAAGAATAAGTAAAAGAGTPASLASAGGPSAGGPPDLADAALRAQLREVLLTDHHVELYPGDPDVVHEQVLDALVGPGQRVLVVVSGPRAVELAGRCRSSGAEVVELVAAPATAPTAPAAPAAPTADLLRRALAEHPGVDLLIVVGTDPVTGYAVDVETLLTGSSEPAPVTLLDATIGLGAVPVETDRWGIDVVIGSVDAGLESLSGVVPVSWSERALERRSWRGGSDGEVVAPVPVSASPSTLPAAASEARAALRVALDRVLTEGLARRWARHAEVGALFQDHLQDRDVQLVIADGAARSPVLTVASWPDEVDAGVLRARLADEHGLQVDAGGAGPDAVTWRIGLYGPAATHAMVDRVLDAIDELLEG